MVSLNTLNSVSLAPGVQFSSNIIDIIPEPTADHAIAYMFVSVPGDQWEASPDKFSSLRPLTPTIVPSLAAYLEAIGGVIPNKTTERAAYDSYKAVEAFFLNSGGNGVLYVIRTAITPQVRIEVTNLTFDYYAIKIDGVYYGDTDFTIGTEVVPAIMTSSIDLADITYDIVDSLLNNEDFTNSYEVQDDDTFIQNGLIYIASKAVATVPTIEVYGVSDPFGTPALVSSVATIDRLTNKRNLAFKLATANQKTIIPIDATLFSSDYYIANDGTNFDEFDAAGVLTVGSEEFSALVSKYILNEVTGYTASTTAYPTYPTYFNVDEIAANPANFLVAIVKTPGEVFPDGTPASGTRNLDTDGLLVFLEPSEAAGVVTFNAASTDFVTELGALKSVDSFALNIDSPTNRFIITTNGATAAEHATVLTSKLESLISSDYILTLVDADLWRDSQESIDEGLDADTEPVLFDSGIYSWERAILYTVESLTSAPLYIFPGTTSNGSLETDVTYTLDDSLGLASSLSEVRVQDYIHAINNSLSANELLPGFLLIPEAYANTSYTSDDRVAISSTLEALARTKDWFALVDDSPTSVNPNDSTEEFNNLVNTVGAARGHMAFYYPYLVTLTDDNLPASPYVAGLALNRYAQESFIQPPAGEGYPLTGVLRPKYAVPQGQLAVNSNRGMNAIVSKPGRGVLVFGARTTRPSTPVQFVNSRIIANIALQALRNSFDGFLFNAIQGSGSVLFTGIRNTAIAILQDLFEQGAFRGATPQEAYQVIVDTSNNSQNTLDQGIVFVNILIAPAGTIERIAISVSITSTGVVSATIV